MVLTKTGPPFLSIYTPTYKRPVLLKSCKNSVAAQTIPVQHVIIPDDIGIGIGGVYASIQEHAHQVVGEYVMVLSDDNILADVDFAADLQHEVAQAGNPDVIVFRGLIGTTMQPALWRHEPVETCIDLSCFAVARPVWQNHTADWGQRYEGDYDFIHALWEQGYRFHWWDRMGFRALQIGRGEPE